MDEFLSANSNFKFCEWRKKKLSSKKPTARQRDEKGGTVMHPWRQRVDAKCYFCKDKESQSMQKNSIIKVHYEVILAKLTLISQRNLILFNVMFCRANPWYLHEPDVSRHEFSDPKLNEHFRDKGVNVPFMFTTKTTWNAQIVKCITFWSPYTVKTISVTSKTKKFKIDVKR